MSGGIANPVEVIEQITHLLFLKRLDEVQELEERKAARLGEPAFLNGARRIFPEGADPDGSPYENFRWTRFKNASPEDMLTLLSKHVFPFLRTIGGGSTYAHYMRDARFTIPTPPLLAKVVDLLDKLPMHDRYTKGDVYEYMLGKLATSGQNGQFRTRATSSASWSSSPLPRLTTCSAIPQPVGATAEYRERSEGRRGACTFREHSYSRRSISTESIVKARRTAGTDASTGRRPPTNAKLCCWLKCPALDPANRLNPYLSGDDHKLPGLNASERLKYPTSDRHKVLDLICPAANDQDRYTPTFQILFRGNALIDGQRNVIASCLRLTEKRAIL